MTAYLTMTMMRTVLLMTATLQQRAMLMDWADAAAQLAALQPLMHA